MKYEEALNKIQDETNKLDARFNAAVECINALKKGWFFSHTEQLIAYKYFKQATVGDCNVQQPPAYRITAYSKYNAWNSLKEMSKSKAMEEYITMMITKASTMKDILIERDVDFNIEQFFTAPTPGSPKP